MLLHHLTTLIFPSLGQKSPVPRPRPPYSPDCSRSPPLRPSSAACPRARQGYKWDLAGMTGDFGVIRQFPVSVCRPSWSWYSLYSMLNVSKRERGFAGAESHCTNRQLDCFVQDFGWGLAIHHPAI